MEQTTWRWYRTWLAWEKRKWKKTGLIDFSVDDVNTHMLAKVCQRIQQVLSKNPGQVQLDDQFIQLMDAVEVAEEEEKPLTREEAAKRSKALWVGMLGGVKGITFKTRPRKK